MGANLVVLLEKSGTECSVRCTDSASRCSKQAER